VRFELIDRVIERTPDRIVALKNVSAAEEYLADHFPGFAVLPGVMMLEALVQAGRLLLAEQAKGAGRPLILAEVRNIRYGNMVRPGQSLNVEVTLKPPAAAADRTGWELTGVGSVDGDVAVQGKFRLAPYSPGFSRGPTA
jgi:3-hydroxyacyl-[acyl-carrier-protein] dehydratase